MWNVVLTSFILHRDEIRATEVELLEEFGKEIFFPFFFFLNESSVVQY